jgi:thiamine biosynthesis lipoprotein
VEISELRAHAFGRVCHLVIANNDDRGAELLHLCQEELTRLEMKYSSYLPDSITNLINQAAGTGSSVPLDAETRSLFLYIDALWHESKHIFDPTTRILDECYNSTGTLRASQSQLEQMLRLVGWRNLKITDSGAHLLEKGMQIDLNSCIRPYALDSLRKLLIRHDVSSAFVEMEQEVMSIGKQPSGANWLVGMRVPTTSRAAIVRLKLNHKGFAFRGDFEHRTVQQGENFGRALSPVDGQPIPGLLSVGIIADNCLTACSAANVARLKTEASGLKWLEKLGLPWVAIDRRLKCHGPLVQKS